MSRTVVDTKELQSEILCILAERKQIEVTSRDLQLLFPALIAERYGHHVMPETLARTWRKMRDPEGPPDSTERCVLCEAEDVKSEHGRAFTRWTINQVRLQGNWLPWSTML